MTTPRNLALYAAVLDEVAGRVDVARRAVRTELGEAMRDGAIKSLTVVAEGQEIGTATRATGRKTVTARVSDPDALLAWAQEHHPHEVETVTRLKPGFESRVLAHSKAAETPCMDGVLDVPGVDVHVSVGEPYLQLRTTDDAPAAVERLWRSGVIDLPALLELPGGGG